MQEALLADNQGAFNRLYNHVKMLKEEMYKNNKTFNQNKFQPGMKTGSLVLQPLIDNLLTELTAQYRAKYNEQLPELGE